MTTRLETEACSLTYHSTSRDDRFPRSPNRSLRRTSSDVDVLLEILSFADRTTGSRIMKTCRVLYREGARPLLKQHRVCLHGGEAQLVSFLRFTRANPPLSFRSFPALVLGPNLSKRGLSDKVGKDLRDFFEALAASEYTNLRGLSLFKAEKLLANHSLATAIAQLTSLKFLSMGESVGAQGSLLLRRPRSSLTSPDITGDGLLVLGLV